jgi:hypothetical protein
MSQPSGKTTRMMETAVELLGELPENCRVFITGAHSPWLFELSQAFREAGLKDIEFFTPSQIINGCLHGRRGILLIDDEWDLPRRDRIVLLQEQRLLRAKL